MESSAFKTVHAKLQGCPKAPPTTQNTQQKSSGRGEEWERGQRRKLGEGRQNLQGRQNLPFFQSIMSMS